MSTLRLAASPRTWRQFHVEPERSPPASRDLVRCWERSRGLGVSLSGPPSGEPVLGGSELQPHRERCALLLSEGQAALEHAARAFSARHHTLLLANAEGVVTHAAGGGGFADEARRLRLVAGADWSETVRGTNAIGTALAEGCAVSVEGAGHFGRRYHDLVCHAVPVVGPGGEVVGILDATSVSAHADPGLATMVAAAARALEVVLRARAWATAGQGARHLVERTLDRLPEPAWVVEAPGRVVRCNPAARGWMGSDAPPRGGVGALGVDWSRLVAEAARPSGGLVVGTGPKTLALRAEPILSADGGLLAVVLFGEARVRRSAPVALVEAAARPDPFAELFATDPAMLRAVDFARRVAASDLAVVLLSETGSGKELFARAMHRASPRREAPFVPVNCGSMTPQLLESELFGYAPGAFTGAERQGREGLFHAANGGTLFLDEVAEMPTSMQTALLRVLETGQYHRLGEVTPRTVDVRVLCATCRDLAGLVAAGDFRKDLFFRLKNVTVTLPPLRERTDLLELAEHLLRDAPPMSAALCDWLRAYDWPGNVRELKSVLEVLQILGAEAPELDVVHLPPDLAGASTVSAPTASSLAGVELATIQRTLRQMGGNVSAAARSLGVARSTIYRILRRHDEAAD